MSTRAQKMAKRSFDAVRARLQDQGLEPSRRSEYASFAKSFPALIQTAGLCQAVAFAQAKGKGHELVLADVVATASISHDERVLAIDAFADRCREESNILTYIQYTRLALQAATWVKRYVEALEDE